jgi:holin-like protein
MKHLFSLMIFFGISVIGDLISDIARLPIPGNILGMAILFILLCLRVIKLEDIKKTGKFLIDNMLLFILPSAVGMFQLIMWLRTRYFYIF